MGHGVAVPDLGRPADGRPGVVCSSPTPLVCGRVLRGSGRGVRPARIDGGAAGDTRPPRGGAPYITLDRCRPWCPRRKRKIDAARSATIWLAPGRAHGTV